MVIFLIIIAVIGGLQQNPHPHLLGLLILFILIVIFTEIAAAQRQSACLFVAFGIEGEGRSEK